MPWLSKHSIGGRPLALTALIAATTASCTFAGDGQPWGEVAFDVTATFEPAERLREGRVLTSRNYAVEVQRIELQLTSVALTLAPSGAATDFDPANPPEGFSLCHNGHCHADSGELVDYEDVALVVARQQGVAGGVTQAIDGTTVLSTTAQQIPLEACSNDCLLGVGSLSSTSLTVGSIKIEGRVFDTLTGEAARLNPEGVAISATVPLNMTMERQIAGEVGKSDPVGIGVGVDFAITGQLFDRIEWAAFVADPQDSTTQNTLTNNEEFRALMAENMSEETRMDVAVSRQELP